PRARAGPPGGRSGRRSPNCAAAPPRGDDRSRSDSTHDRGVASLDVRRALLSVAVGLAGAACVTASGWALPAAALPPPTPAARVAAEASAWFHDYRLVVDVFHFHHRRMTGACLR